MQAYRHYLIAGLFVLGTLGSNCASVDRDYTVLTNYLDRTVVPEDTTARWVAAPVLIPLTVTSFAADNLLVMPAMQLGSAVLHARDYVVEEPIYDTEGYYSYAALRPIQLALTPVIFIAGWFGGSVAGWDLHEDALWNWPEWGRRWHRDADGQLLGPEDPDIIRVTNESDTADDALAEDETDAAANEGNE